MNINNTFNIDEYNEAYSFVQANKGTTIKDLGEGLYQIIDTKPTPEEMEQQENEHIGKLHLTKREVFLGLHKAKQVTPDMIKAQITEPETLIEFEYATEYFRGNPLINIIGSTLGITPKQLDRFFETKDYKYLANEN